jgi:ABC-type antimicrobial peptide transport system permease subunit
LTYRLTYEWHVAYYGWWSRVLLDSLIMVAIGAVVGAPAVLVLTRYTESLLFGVKPQDPVTIVAAALLLFVVTALAGFLPALRATRVQPMDALRQE